MFPRRGAVVLWCLLHLVVAEDPSSSGLVLQDSKQDLVAEASNSREGVGAQKREGALSNSYGEPLPADAYGPPPQHLLHELNQPAPVYGVPEFQNNIFPQEPPPGAYGPPTPVVFPTHSYEGPPPPIGKPKPVYGLPKQYGPPKPTYGPPKPIYGPPKKSYGPPKQSLPKPIYGVPFKPPKVSVPKPIYGPPKPVYGTPKPVYGPPKPVYGPPKATYGPPLPSIPNLPPIPELPPINLPQSSSVSANFDIDTNVDLGFSLPAPIYGTPIPNLPINLKPNFPIPSDTYGPPGHSLGPIGPNDQLVVHNADSGHYGPPQPDPNPRPPHPGIPAPPTPPHVLYDGWKPIPGISKPLLDHGHHNSHHHHHHHNLQQIEEHYGPPPPPPVQEVHLNLDGHSLPHGENAVSFSGAQINTGYSNVHQDALANIDLNAIVGGDSNHIDQSKTVFEAHYTENAGQHSHNTIFTGPEKIKDTYGAPPLESLSGGHYPNSIRQQGAKGLIPPSGIYGVPPGSQYGAPPKHPNGRLPGINPRRPIRFREPVPEGLLQHVGHSTHHKDVHGINHSPQPQPYLPPPIRDVKDVNQHTGNAGVSISIEPSDLYSLPHAGNPISFHPLEQKPNNLYGSPIDSYSVPLLTVGDHSVSSSNTNAVTATLDGSIFANLSNLEAAAILKHCPYHEAIIKAARAGEKIPSDLASNYVASLSSLGSTLSKSQQTSISPQNGFNVPVAGSESVSYSSKDLSTASHTLVETILPTNDIKKEKTEKNSIQKGKSIKDDSGKHSFKQDDRLQYVSQQIQQTSEKIRNLSEETKQLHQKIVSSTQNFNQFGQTTGFAGNIPVSNGAASYSIQIQSSDEGKGKPANPSIPHEQLLSEGLLQSILQAIEQPNQPPPSKIQNQNVNFEQSSSLDFKNYDLGGLVLPAGYEPIDRTKDNKINDQQSQSSNQIRHIHSENQSHRGDIPHTDCDSKADNSITHTIVVPPPNNNNNIENVQHVNDVDNNDVAIYFGDNSDDKDKNEPVTEISVATSISENVNEYSNERVFGAKLAKS
ncbi:unnamed protein product [Chilo suppressalis]|uniref:Uncharacterized protein n=1 Tax=Chilo suppressalis TaxID=168631 RepID=A0ABN8L5N1_CHISP|nr:unnamed protein product [Chilo suppressalis]